MFDDDYDELQFLRVLVTRLRNADQAGRTTAHDSYDLDYCWDMIEQYYEFHQAREVLGELI